MKYFLLFCTVASLAAPSMAEPFTYGPDTCEFQTTFPEKPFIQKKCAPSTETNSTACTEVVTFTKALGADASTDFRVTCQAISDKEREQYTSAILEETLKKMSKDKGLEVYSSHAEDKGIYHTATALSLSERDGKPLMYSSQLWVGKKSMFTVESEIIGNKNPEIEKVFADILKKTYPKDTPPAPQTEKTEKKQKNENKKD